MYEKEGTRPALDKQKGLTAAPASSPRSVVGRRQAKLRHVAQRLAAEEVAAVYRHDLTGKLGAARMLIYTLKRRTIGEGAPMVGDQRTAETVELLESALKGALAMLDRQLFVEEADLHDPFDAHELLADVLSEAVAAGRVTLASAAPVWLDADADEIAIATVALVENALNAASNVEVRIVDAGERGRIEVLDDGPGVPEAADDATPFTTTVPGHLGIGLRLVRRVARRWSGRFQVGRDGDRTIACLELPAIPARRSELP